MPTRALSYASFAVGVVFAVLEGRCSPADTDYTWSWVAVGLGGAVALAAATFGRRRARPADTAPPRVTA